MCTETGTFPFKKCYGKAKYRRKNTQRDAADPAHHQPEQLDMASCTAIKLQTYPDHTHYSRILYSKDFQLHFSPFCNAWKRHRLASGRRGALLLVCLKHRSASPFPKESALPKAIGCHNRSALRPWVNICARCLFELLQPRYLPRTPPGLIRELMAPHQEITLCEGSREREGGKEL